MHNAVDFFHVSQNRMRPSKLSITLLEIIWLSFDVYPFIHESSILELTLSFFLLAILAFGLYSVVTHWRMYSCCLTDGGVL